MENSLYTKKSFKKDSIIYMERSQNPGVFYIVEKGSLTEIVQFPNFEETTKLLPGDTFGLITCLTGKKYNSRVIAMTDCDVIVVKRAKVIPFLSAKSEIFLKVISNYSNKLRFLNQKLISLANESIYEELPEMIMDAAAFFKANDFPQKYLYALEIYQDLGRDEKIKQSNKNEIDHLINAIGVQKDEAQKLNTRMVYKPGQIIFLEQEMGSNFFYIEKGKVKISHFTREKEFILAILDEGEFFGEMALLNQVPRNASALAYSDCRILTLEKENLFSELKEPILSKIFTSLARRLWYSYRRVLNLSYQNPVTRLYDFLDLIMSSKENKQQDDGYQFDFSFEELKGFTNTQDIPLSEIDDFLMDKNISINYGLISINDRVLFENKRMGYISHERNIG